MKVLHFNAIQMASIRFPTSYSLEENSTWCSEMVRSSGWFGVHPFSEVL